MLRNVLYLAVLVIAVFFSTGAIAHPGHGTLPSDSPAHFFEPVHALWIVAAFLLLQLGWKRAIRYLNS